MSAGASIVDLPEPFASALQRGAFSELADAPATSSVQRYGRGIARMHVGREAEARADFEAAMPELGDACLIELAYLDLRQRSDVNEALRQSRQIIKRSPPESALLARAYHVAGLAEGKLRRSGAAIDLLLKSTRLYRMLADPARRAQVYDTIGSIQAARGRLDHAVHFYALSLVDKSLLNDRAGMAITLGNIGRVHLRVGRFEDALECFEHDLEIATQLGDQRGIARMHEDIGRTNLAAGNLAIAETSLVRCLEAARGRGFVDLGFFARKDLALLRIAQGRLEDAATELKAAESLLPGGAEPYLQQVLTAARGELALAKEDPAAADLLEKAVNAFRDADLPDLEIPARISLARALLKQKLKQTAQDCLLKGMQRARSDGYARYLPTLKQEMTRLDLVEGIIEEKSRPLVESPAVQDDGYVILQRLGGGGFGEVFRAYDPQRACDVALKRFQLGKLYDTRRRKSLIASARLELEAASRVRHPGVVRVMAVGFDPQGELYVVQEFIEGQPLRGIMAERRHPEPGMVMRYLSLIANALQALHDGTVVHRDLKPDNVIVKPDELPVLVDFGIAHVARPEPGSLGAAVVGTPTYMAPEQARGAAIDGRADLYALGVMAYEWFSGVLPLRPRGENMKQVALELTAGQPQHLAIRRPDLSGEQADLVMSLLAKDPNDRPSPAGRVAESFDRFASLSKPRNVARAAMTEADTVPKVSKP